MIYFDNAATTQMSDVAIDALIKVSKDNYGNASSIYSYGIKSRKLLDESRGIIAECIGAEPEEIYFTSGGTESDNWSVSQAVFHAVDHIITSKVEHHAILNPIKNLENSGMQVTYLPVDSGCVVDTNTLKDTLNGNKVFVSLMFQNNETGVIQPIKQAAQIVHVNNPSSIFHTDAVQAIGHIKIDVKDLGVDMLSASAHKFNGPKGVGFLYIRKGLNVSPMITGGGQEYGLRSGTENVASIYAMAKALEENINRLDIHAGQIKYLEKLLFDGFMKNNIKYWLNGNSLNRNVGVLNISINGVDAEGLLNVLDMHNIFISIGSACNAKEKEPSYVLLAMGLDEHRIDSAVRISIGRYNSEAEIDELVQCVKNYYYIVNKS